MHKQFMKESFLSLQAKGSFKGCGTDYAARKDLCETRDNFLLCHFLQKPLLELMRSHLYYMRIFQFRIRTVFLD